jgi:hypothetical protein
MVKVEETLLLLLLLLATALQLDMVLLQIQYVDLQIFLETRVYISTTLTDRLFVVFCFVLCCLIAAVVCIRADSVIGQWLLSSARK